MDRAQFEQIAKYRKPKRPLIGAVDGTTKTLLYGLNDRSYHHVYQRDGILHLVDYNDIEVIRHARGAEMLMENLVPEYNLYPELCDFAFVKAMVEAGVVPSFMGYDPSRSLETWGGLVGLADDPELDKAYRPLGSDAR